MCIVIMLAVNDEVYLGSDNHVIVFENDVETIKSFTDLITAKRETFDVGSKIIQLDKKSALAYGSSTGQKHRHILSYCVAELDYTTDPNELAQVPGLGGILYSGGRAWSIKNGKVYDLDVNPAKGNFGLYFYSLPCCDEIIAKTFSDNVTKMSGVQAIFNTIKRLHLLTNGLVGNVPHIIKFNTKGEYECIC